MIQLKDVIHYYLNSEFEFVNQDGRKFYGVMKEFSVSSLSIYMDIKRNEDGAVYSKRDNSEWHCWVYLPDVKPILRRLEDITDEEIKEMLNWDKILGMYSNCSFEKAKGGINISYTIGEDEYMSQQYHHISFYMIQPEHLPFMFKNGFDLFNLINRGQAVDAKTI